MGWDVNLAGLFRFPKHPIIRFLEIAECFEKSSYFSKLFDLTIYEQFREPVEIFDRKNGLNVEHLQQILEPYFQKDCEFVGWWSADERYTTDDKDSQKFMRTGYRVAIQIPADKYTSILSSTELSFVYEIGNSNLFSLSFLNQIAHLNFEAVVQEILVLSELGISTIQGINIDAERDPCKSFLMYHGECSAFGTDLGEQLGTLEASLSLTKEDIRRIVQMNKDIEYQELGTGVIIFHGSLIDGNLKSFYSTLEKYLKAVS